MAVYAIGDIQGCHDELQQLLQHLAFSADRDQLWFVGDLVNRGPKSLQVLRFVKDLGDAAITVLGNHDLHLLALACGNPKHKNENSLDPILQAPDRDELLHWLRHRPLMHSDPDLRFHMIHAGLPPQWDIAAAQACARELETALQGNDHLAYFLDMYGNKPKRWSPSLSGMDRLRFITNCFTRLRYCDDAGDLHLKEKGPPGSQKPGLMPWFQHPTRASRDARILFGHWSTLGYQAEQNTWALDTGCLWGERLTALRLDQAEPRPHQIACEPQQNPFNYL